MRRRYWRASALAGLLGLISVGMIDSATAHHTPPRPVAIATVPNLAMHADALLARINVFQQPIKTAGDLSEAADAAPGITTEDLARDLEAAAKSGVPSERELLLEILWRLRRIEEHLGVESSGRFHRSTGGQFTEQPPAPEFRTVVSPYPPGESRSPVGNQLERLKHLTRLWSSREGEVDRPEESSKLEDWNGRRNRGRLSRGDGHKGYAITMAQECAPDGELVIDDNRAEWYLRAFLPEVEAASGSPDLLTKEVARYGDEIIGGIARSDCFDFNDTKLDDPIGGLY